MAVKYAKRMDLFKKSELGEILKLIEEPDIISFAGGLPASELFPVEEMKKVSVKVLDENDEEVELKESIDYGETNFNAILNSDKNFSGNKEDSQAFEQAGFQTQEFVNDELQTVDASGEVFSDGEEN